MQMVQMAQTAHPVQTVQTARMARTALPGLPEQVPTKSPSQMASSEPRPTGSTLSLALTVPMALPELMVPQARTVLPEQTGTTELPEPPERTEKMVLTASMD